MKDITQEHKLQKKLRTKITMRLEPEGYMKNILRFFVEYLFIRKIKKLSKDAPQCIEHPKTIVFNRVYSRFTKLILIEIAIAKTLQLMGHNVFFLICGKKMKHCTTVFTIEGEKESLCDNCIAFGESVLKAAKIPFLTYNHICFPVTNGYFDKKCINSSLERYLKGGFSKDLTSIENDLTNNARNSYEAANCIFKTFKPDIVFSNHYAYAEWNPFYSFMIQNNVKYVVWNVSYGETKVILDLEKIGERFLQTTPFTEKEEKEIDEYLMLREKGKADTSIYDFDDTKKIDTHKYKKSFCMFLNVPWDSGLVDSHSIFRSVYDWVDCTIDFFKENPDKLLLIKSHPAERIDKSVRTMVDYINRKHILTDNIIVVDDDTSAYTLYNVVDVGLVYTTTAGIEMAIKGKPVIVSSNIFYARKGFTTDAVSRADYLEKLKKCDATTPDVKKAKHFAYFYMLESTVPLTFLYNGLYGWKFTIKRFRELLEDKNMKKLVKYILE